MQVDDDSPAAALAAIDEQQQRTEAALAPNPLGMFLPWGLGYLVAFGSVWLAIQGLLPVPATVALVALAAVGAATFSTITIVRSSRGIAGPSARVGAMYGWSWFLGFATLGTASSAVAQAGVTPEAMSLVWSVSALTVVGLLYLAGGALFDSVAQYVLGVWTLCAAVLAAFVGYPSNFLVLALAGGGGFVALGLWVHLRGHR